MNPQSLNRYSYVLNNPLKYVDPSGHIFNNITYEDYIAGMEMGMDVVPEAVTIAIAWENLREAAPELTNMIEESQDVVSVIWSSEPDEAGFKRAKYTEDGNLEILVNWKHRNTNPRVLASLLGHEGFHAAIAMGGINSKSAANEAFAYSLQYRISVKLGIKPDLYSEVFSDYNPYTNAQTINDDLKTAQTYLFNMSTAYRSWFGLAALKRWPSWWEGGRTSFLTIAKSVWVK